MTAPGGGGGGGGIGGGEGDQVESVVSCAAVNSGDTPSRETEASYLPTRLPN